MGVTALSSLSGPKRDLNNVLYLLILLTVAILYIILSLVTPPYIDDWMFMGEWMDTVGGTKVSWDGFVDFVRFTRDYDNGRLANLISPFTTLITPFKDLFPYVNGCFYAFLIFLVQRLACGKATGFKNFMLVISWASLLVFVPWYDNILIFDYTLNYLWSCVVCLLYIFFLLINEPKGWNVWKISLGCLLAVLAGAFHEGFAVPTLCGLGLLAIVRKGKMSPTFYCLCILMIVVTLVFMLSEGIINRIGYTLPGEYLLPPKRVLLIVCIVVACFIGLSLNSKGRSIILQTVKSPLFPICIGIFLSSYAIGFLTVKAPRCYFFGNVALTILLLNLIFNILIKISEKGFLGKFISYVATPLILIGCVLQTVGVIYWQKKYGDETRKIYSMIEASDSGIIYHDFINTMKPPFYALGMPVDLWVWRSFWEYRALNWYYKKPFMSVVPTDIKKIDFERMSPLEGNLGSWISENYVFTRPCFLNKTSPIDYPQSELIKITMNNGEVKEDTYTFFPFINPSNPTDTLLYLRMDDIEPANLKGIDILSFNLTP